MLNSRLSSTARARSLSRRLGVLLLAAAALPGQAPVPRGIAAGSSLQRIHTDRAADGAIWVLAPGYKARFGPGGVDYIPYFGARAPRNFPVHFRLATIRRGEAALDCDLTAEPVLEGDQVTFVRGAVREVWHLRLDAVEQTFVLDDLRGEGDLVARIDVESTLAAGRDARGLRFRHPTLGEVRYGDVLAFDHAGRSARSAARFDEGSIELRVASALLSVAEPPLTVDPLVRTIAVNRGNDQVFNADIAFEPNSATWLVAYVRSFSSTDTDIISRRFDSAGNFLDEVIVATGSRESRNPSVAANGQSKQFLIAWDEDTGIADRVILGRLRIASSNSQGQTFTVLDSPGIGIDDLAPAVGGGNANDAGSQVYAVLCVTGGRNGHVLNHIAVNSIGQVTQRLTLSPSTHDVVDVRIAKARSRNAPWVCTYLRSTGGVNHVHMAEVPLNGSNFRRVAIDESGDCQLGGVAGTAPDFFAVYSKVVSTANSNVFGRAFRLNENTNSTTLRPIVDLTAVEPGGLPTRDQRSPAVSFDGVRYTVAYQEDVAIFGTHDIRAMVVSIPEMVFSDGHRLMHDLSTSDEQSVAIASTGEMGGPIARSMVVFDRDTRGDLDVDGSLFDGFSPFGGVSFVASKCGRIDVSALDEPLLGGTLRLRASPFDLQKQLFAIGLPSPPVQLCSLGCKLGVAPILALFPGVSLDIPIPRDPGLLGATIAVQNALLGGTAGCLPPSLAVEISDTMVIQVR